MYSYNNTLLNHYYYRNTLKSLYKTREAILEESIVYGTNNGFRRRGLRLRPKLGIQRQLFENRLASLLVDFSARMPSWFHLSIKDVTDIAKVWILVNTFSRDDIMLFVAS